MPLPEPENDEHVARPVEFGWSFRLRQLAGQAMVRSGLADVMLPAAKQIQARQVDPLSVDTSYVVLRNGIGVLGFAFPIVLILGAGLDHVQGSLSAYYHFSPSRPSEYGAGTVRDLFVGILCTIGAFLLFYRGHSLQEDVALNIAGIGAVLVALFPMDWPPDEATAMTLSAKLHSVCATTFFVMIAYACVFRARDTLCILDDARRRKKFERLYLVFGILMVATPATVALLELISPPAGPGYATLIVETGGVFVFATYWLVKGFEIRSSVRRRMIVPI